MKRSNFIKSIALWATGVAVGFTPILFMMLLFPGFFIAFWESVRFLFEIKTTNLILQVPWPWRLNVTTMPLGDIIRGILIGLFFIGIVVFGVLSLIWVFWKKFQNKQVLPVLVATSCLALPYAHYAYSRADVTHLALGIFPSLVGCLALLAVQPGKIKWPLTLMLCASSLWVMYPFHPGWQCHVRKQCVNIEVSNNNLLVDQGTASDIGFLHELADKYAPKGRSFITTPFWLGAYPVLQRKSPMWEIYAFFSHPRSFELAEIARIKAAKPGFVVVLDIALDGRDDLRFRNTHPLIHKYILDNFEQVMDETYIKVKWNWVYLYRAVDKEGQTIDFMLSEKRDEPAARAFFNKAINSNGLIEKVTMDKSGANKAGVNTINLALALQHKFVQNNPTIAR